MIGRAAFVAPARRELDDARLRRPDWTTGCPRDPRLLWLDKNENTDPVLLAVVARVMTEMDPRTAAIYPEAGPLYRILAEHLGVSQKSLALAPGSDGVIGAVFRAFIERGDRVLLTDPTYAMYPVYGLMHGAETTKLAYVPGETGPFLPPDTVIEAIGKHRPKLVCLPNPDSPTGTVFDPPGLRRILQHALNHGALVLVDEAYYPFYPNTVVPWLAEFPNLIIARTFSKAWGLTGLRLGCGIASPDVAALLQKVRPNYEVNQVAVTAAVRMISDFEREMSASVARLNRGRDVFVAAMKELGLRTTASHASFCHVAFDRWADRVHAALADVVLYRADSDTPCLKGFSRFSATTSDLFQPVIARIRNVVRGGA